MPQNKEAQHHTAEALGKQLQEAHKRMQEKMASDPAYKEQMERLDRILFGPQPEKEPQAE